MTEEEYYAAYPTFAKHVSYAQWRGDEPVCETMDIIESGGVRSAEPLRLWYSNGCRILTDLSNRPWCVAPCLINDNYYVSCVYGDWTVHYLSVVTSKSRDFSIREMDVGADWRMVNDWIRSTFKIRDRDTRIIRIVKASVVEALESLKITEKEAAE